MPDPTPELGFFIEGASLVARAFIPTLALGLRVVNGTPAPVYALLLRCQIYIEPARRAYQPAEQAALTDVFGAAPRWGETLRPWLWQQTTLAVGSFTGTTVAALPLPCSFDFNLAATKYFAGLTSGDCPLRIMFSGTVYYQHEDRVAAAPVPWTCEAGYRLPLQLWRDLMASYQPACAWLCLPAPSFARLRAYATATGAPSLEAAFDSVLATALPKLEAALEVAV